MPASRRSSEPVRRLTSIDQLSAADIRRLLDWAADYATTPPRPIAFSATLLMLQPSLRTRLGFAEAIRRLGGTAHVVTAIRETGDASAPESLSDTLRVASDVSDLVVARIPERFGHLTEPLQAPLLSAGDALEHPSQAIVDLFAFERLAGPIEGAAVGICGDMTLRATRSLLKALAKIRPGTVRVAVPPARMGDAAELLGPIHDRVTWDERPDWSDLDILYLAGLPEHRDGDTMPTDARAAYALSPTTIDGLSPRAIVLSPMPVIDEIGPQVRGDPRIRMFEQNALGVAARMAIVSDMLGLGE